MDQKPQKAWWENGLQLFAQVSGWIVFPIIAAVYLGRWLDRKYDNEPWLFLLCVGIAFVISNIGIIKVGLKAMREIVEQDKKDQAKKKIQK